MDSSDDNYPHFVGPEALTSIVPQQTQRELGLQRPILTVSVILNSSPIESKLMSHFLPHLLPLGSLLDQSGIGGDQGYGNRPPRLRLKLCQNRALASRDFHYLGLVCLPQ